MTRIRILIRSLFKNRVTSIITITGFSFSISIALVIVAFIIGEFSYDKAYPNADRIYRVFANENISSVREDFREYFTENYAAIENTCRYNNYNATLTYEDKPFTGQMIVTDNSFFEIFSIQFLAGSPNSLFGNLNDVVLTESFASKIFGDEDPIGKTLVAEYQFPLVVSGVVKDFSTWSSIQGDFITSSRLRILYEGSNDGQGNEVNYFRLFILVKEPGNISGLEKLLTDDICSRTYTVGYSIDKISLIPFKKSYFMQGVSRSQTRHANLKLIKLLCLTAGLIVLLSIFNFINLTTASHTDRFKEIGIKKTIGALRRQIFNQFMTESFIICFTSFLIAIFISSFWVPFFEKFLDRNVVLDALYKPEWLVCLVLGIIVISLLSGIYPALFISGLKPVTILTRMNGMNRKSLGFRASLNIVQYSVSVTLIIALIVLSRQIDFVRSKDFGFETDKLLRVDVHWRLEGKTKLIRDRLLSEPTIKNICFSHGTPGSIYLNSSWDFNGREGIISQLTVDSAFFEVFNVPVIKGREPLRSDFNKVCYINETAFRETGWDTFEGKRLHGNEIIGIIKDFHFANLYNKITPLAVVISNEMGISHLTIKVDPGDLPGTINYLAATWDEICPGHELKYQFYDDYLGSMYGGEEKLAASISLFAILAIIISCLGILGLAEFSIRKRTKEIGIRIINGASVAEVMILLNKDFVRWVIIAFFIAAPVGWFLMNKWLETFAYKTSLSWWIFVLSGLIALAIAIMTVSWQSWRAATRNPVDALRYE